MCYDLWTNSMCCIDEQASGEPSRERDRRTASRGHRSQSVEFLIEGGGSSEAVSPNSRGAQQVRDDSEQQPHSRLGSRASQRRSVSKEEQIPCSHAFT